MKLRTTLIITLASVLGAGIASAQQKGTSPLSVNITDVQVGGRALPIKTAGAIGLEQSTHKTRRGVSVSTYSYQVLSGRKIEFRLAQPLNL